MCNRLAHFFAEDLRLKFIVLKRSLKATAKAAKWICFVNPMLLGWYVASGESLHVELENVKAKTDLVFAIFIYNDM